MKLKRQGYGQVTDVLAANVIPSVGYMKNDICLVNKKSIILLRQSFT